MAKLEPVMDAQPIAPSTLARAESLKRLLGGLACAALLLLLIEGPAALGLVDYVPKMWINQAQDPELFQVNRPYSRVSGMRTGGSFAAEYSIPAADMSVYQWDERNDGHGFRNPMDLRRADIVVLGSSFVEGETVPQEDLMTTILAQRRHAAVANLGRNAYGPQQEFIVLKRYGLPLQPRTIIWMISDYTELRQATVYRAWIRSRSVFERSFTRSAYNSIAGVLRHFESAIRDSFVENRTARGLSRSGIVEDSDGKPRRLYFLYPGRPLDGEDMWALDEEKRDISAGFELGRKQGARLLVVFIPDKFRVFQPVAKFAPGSEASEWVVNDAPDRLAKGVRSISPEIGFLDLTPAFIEAARRGAITYYSDDTHWSAEGQSLAAATIDKYLTVRDQ